MISGKQRSYLKGLANNLKPIIQVGKEGVSDNFLDQYLETIASKELVKINVLDSSPEDAKEVSRIICERTNSEFVSVLGRKVVLYRRPDKKKDEILIKLPE